MAKHVTGSWCEDRIYNSSKGLVRAKCRACPILVLFALVMIPPDATTLLGQVRQDLAEIQILRHQMDHASDQISRDHATILYSRALDQIVSKLQQLEATGLLDYISTL